MYGDAQCRQHLGCAQLSVLFSMLPTLIIALFDITSPLQLVHPLHQLLTQHLTLVSSHPQLGQ